MVKKDRCAVFGCNNDRLFSREIYIKVLFLPEKSAKILHKFDKFKMAAVSVKWSIQ